MSASRKYRITLFGATGFTGGLCARYLAMHLPADTPWAIAGRNPEKLEAVRDNLAGNNRPDIVQADVNDQDSLNHMAADTRVVITTVGPYVLYGEGLVRACADNGTHYTDLTGEPEFVNRLLPRYHEGAVRTGAAIVNCCGFDSIPHDAGAFFTVRALEQLHGGSLDVPVSVTGVVTASGSFSGGTWQSALTAFSRLRENREAMQQARVTLNHLYPRRSGHLPLRPHKDTHFSGWLCPLPTIDPMVVARSARALECYGPDFRYGHFVATRSLPRMVAGVAGIGGLFVLAQLGPTRRLLLNTRKSGEGPSAEKRSRSWFRVQFLGRTPDHEVLCEVSGGDPGYDETAKMLSETAMRLALDDNQPRHTGIVTPVMALEDRLVERLQAAGMRFEVLESRRL